MGKIISNRSLTAKDFLQLTPPVILCVSRLDFDRAITENVYQKISLNLPLAKQLAGLDLPQIRLMLTSKVQEILPQGEPIYLVDYEMLFDPRYELDVLRLFIELSKRSKLIIKWCGTTDGDALIYAEQGYVDYKRYKISDYDVVVIK